MHALCSFRILFFYFLYSNQSRTMITACISLVISFGFFQISLIQALIVWINSWLLCFQRRPLCFCNSRAENEVLVHGSWEKSQHPANLVFEQDLMKIHSVVSFCLPNIFSHFFFFVFLICLFSYGASWNCHINQDSSSTWIGLWCIDPEQPGSTEKI